MTTDLPSELIESYLAEARAAALRREWPAVLDLAGDVLVLDRDNSLAHTLRTLAEQHVGRGQPSWGRRQETVLFADLVSSTAMATRFDPEFVRRLTRDYELACTPAITGLGGHMHRFVGDGILASFGYPTSHEDDARRAVQAGLDLVIAVAEASKKYEPLGAGLEVRVGIASGVLVHADRGVGNWVQAGDLFGEAVNLAARLHDVAAPGQVCLSAETADLVDGFFVLERLDDRHLKGFDEPVAVYCASARTTATGWLDRSAQLSRFVNRHAEFIRLGAYWSAIADAAEGELGPFTALFVAGDPGVGKSRLLRELVLATQSPDRTVVEMQCSAYRSSSPLQPVRDYLERRCGFESDDDDATRYAKLTDVVGSRLDPQAARSLATLLGLRLGDDVEPLELSPAQLREVTLGHLTEWIVGAAVRAPTILIVEDLHWADPSTRELLQRVTALRPPGLFAVVTSRMPPAWIDAAGFELMTLLPLSHDDACKLAEAAAGDDLAAHVAEEIAERSDGVPLYVEQLVDTMTRGTTGESRDHVIPLPLTELLQARLDSTGSSKRVAQLAATVGREFEPDFMDAFAERLLHDGRLDPLDRPVRDHLDRLVDSRILETDPIDARLLRFRHGLVAEAAYESQLHEERPERHEVLAELLMEQGTDGGRVADPSVVAFHYARANRPVDAIGQYIEAAGRNHAVGAFAEVTANMDHAESLLPAVPEQIRDALELAIVMSRGLAVSSAGGYTAPGVATDFGRAVELCEALRDVRDLGPAVPHALLGLWTYFCTTADFVKAAAISASIEQHLGRVTMAAGQPSFHACRGVESFFTGDFNLAHDQLEHAIELVATDDIDVATWPLPHDLLAAVLAFSGPVRFIRGDEAGALEAVALGLERCDSLTFPLGPFSRAFVRVYEAWLHRLRGDEARAIDAAGEVVQLGEQYGFFDWLTAGHIQLMAGRAMQNPSIGMLNDMNDAIASWRAVGGNILLPLLLAEQGLGCLSLGEVDRARASLAGAEELAVGQQMAEAELHRLRAELAARTNGPDDPMVARELTAGIELAQRQGAQLFVLRCAAAHERLLGPAALNAEHGRAFADARRAYGPSVDRLLLAGRNAEII